ncbi:MAG: acyl-CoA dehydrogenase family protein [Candidatus Binataceae bacterium]
MRLWICAAGWAPPQLRQRANRSRSSTSILQALKYSLYRDFSRLLRVDTPGPEGSISKIRWSELDQRMEDFAVGLQGPAGQLGENTAHAIDSGRWQLQLLRARSATIGAGTSEIHRNTIAQRILGMPKGH